MYNNSLIDTLMPDYVEIGKNFISAPGSIILAHDASLVLLYKKYRIEKTAIGDNVFLGANSVILPGIIIGDNVIIGAGSVVTKNIPSNSVFAGNPARYICDISEYYGKCKNKNVLYDMSITMKSKFDSNVKFEGKDLEEFRKNVNCEFKDRVNTN